MYIIMLHINSLYVDVNINGKSTSYAQNRHLCSNEPFAKFKQLVSFSVNVSSYDVVDPGKPIELLWLMRSQLIYSPCHCIPTCQTHSKKSTKSIDILRIWCAYI